MAKAKPGQRVVLHLDPRIALEAIILNRHERIPSVRRQEWLRGLLVQGFLLESQTLRGAPDDAKRRSTAAFTYQMAGASQRSVNRPLLESAEVKVRPAQASATSKPFAALGKVIG